MDNNGKVIIKLSTNKKNGRFTAEVIGHEGNFACSDELDRRLLQELMTVEIPGFDNFVEIDDSGKTKEYFNQKNKGHKFYQDNISDAPFIEEESSSKSKKQKLDLGYGV
jgi:hypothetical protein